MTVSDASLTTALPVIDDETLARSGRAFEASSCDLTTMATMRLAGSGTP